MLLITADLHGSLQALEALVDVTHRYDIEQVLIAGDLCPKSDPQFLTLLAHLPNRVLVRGNSDSPYQYSQANLALPPLILTLEYCGFPITLTHGHLDVPYTIGGIIISAHTHIPHLYEDEKHTLWVNPGSPARPRSAKGPTYALLTEDEVGIYQTGSNDQLFSHRLNRS